MTDMITSYLLSAVFILLLLAIFAWKSYTGIRRPQTRDICLGLIGIVAAYVAMDAASVAYFLNPFDVSAYRVVNFFFYVVYVVTPYIWHLFVRNFVGAARGKALRRLELIPLAVLLLMIVISPATGSLWSISELGVYSRGPLYPAFAVLNLFYYVETLVEAIAVSMHKENGRASLLVKAVPITLLPLFAIFTNSFVLPLSVIFPLQPCCLMLMAVLGYLFMADRETNALEAEHQRELQAALDQAQEATRKATEASLAKTEFLHRMSHDMRTPLNGILGLLRISEAHPDDVELAKVNREKAEIAAKHLLSLIDDVLQTSKLEEGSLKLAREPIDLASMTRDIMSIVVDEATGAGLTWEYERGKASIPFRYVYGSELHLRQVFLNIYSNCIKYNRDGGKICTVVEGWEDRPGHGMYRWTISDTGIGMSPEFLEHIFEPFSQEAPGARSTYGGTGLGMSITKSLVELMDGTIDVKSTPGKGSVFTVEIPLDEAPKPEAAAPATACDRRDIHGLKLLMAEDNELNAEIARTLLEDARAQVTVVGNGQEALDALTQSPAGTFDAVLMDVMMPVMDGLAAARAIRALDREDVSRIPIIAMTANAFAEDREACLAAGMDAHLSKPLDIDAVINAIDIYVHREDGRGGDA